MVGRRGRPVGSRRLRWWRAGGLGYNPALGDTALIGHLARDVRDRDRALDADSDNAHPVLAIARRHLGRSTCDNGAANRSDLGPHGPTDINRAARNAFRNGYRRACVRRADARRCVLTCAVGRHGRRPDVGRHPGRDRSVRPGWLVQHGSSPRELRGHRRYGVAVSHLYGGSRGSDHGQRRHGQRHVLCTVRMRPVDATGSSWCWCR